MARVVSVPYRSPCDTPPRLVAGLCYLQHAFALSDEAVVSPLGGEPVLAAFLRGDILSTPSAD